MSKIYEQSRAYRTLKPYVVWTFKKFYRPYIVTGRENIPQNGRIIFAPNHRNALMDALAILSITPSHFSASFLARADIFRKKTIAKLLRFAKLMPAFRIRDGYENLGRNNDTFEMSSDLLLNGNALCLMPEGNQETEQRIRPLVKGIFRIAFATQEKCNDGRPVQIIPIGIDYGSIFKFGKHIIINIGKPVDVSAYMQTYTENQAQAMNELRDRLSSELKKLTVDIQSTQYYDEVLTAVDMASQTVEKQADKTINAFVKRQQTALILQQKEQNEPEAFAAFAQQCKTLSHNTKELRINLSSLFNNSTSQTQNLFDALLLILTLPVFLQGFIFNAIPFFLPVYLRKKVFKAQFDGFFSSLHYGTGIAIFPLYYILSAASLALITAIPYWAILISIPFQLVLGKWALTWYGEMRKLRGRFRLHALYKSKNKKLIQTIELKNRIMDYTIK
ncbi:MAG: 1-acyl-sn-glycerol-3-phosphate acyltransferase [Paludibacteraceae bacterium]|nr:1-acyl-sn-glycerol-3-phosphate acyltransferase [Paludibacteraceae bacterium]